MTTPFTTRLIAVAATTALLGACTDVPQPEQESDSGPLNLLTVNYPLQYFAERVGDEFIDARYPGPADADPAAWNPGPETIREYQQADVVVLNGAGYAGWINRADLPLAKQLDASAGIMSRLLPAEDTVAGTHDFDREHTHDAVAAIVWLDPELAAAQAIAIHEKLAELLPDQTEILKNNLAALTSDLWELHTGLKEGFAAMGQRPVIFSRPVYQYLDQRYQLNGRNLNWKHDELPADTDFAQLIDMNGGLMLWDAAPLPRTVERLEAMGITSVVFDPVATQPDSGDYLTVMQDNLQRLRATLQ